MKKTLNSIALSFLVSISKYLKLNDEYRECVNIAGETRNILNGLISIDRTP
jgi:hypothetical protein